MGASTVASFALSVGANAELLGTTNQAGSTITAGTGYPQVRLRLVTTRPWELTLGQRSMQSTRRLRSDNRARCNLDKRPGSGYGGHWDHKAHRDPQYGCRSS